MMHLQPSASPAPLPRYEERTPAARIARFLSWLYGDQSGYIELIAGRANAERTDKIELDIKTRRWLYYDAERPDLLDAAAATAAAYAISHGNVYVGVRLYTRQAKTENKRSEAYTVPSRVIFVDDAPDAPSLPYSALVQTSANSRHAYYKCDRPTTKDDARRVTKKLGGDPSGVDLTQLVRVPASFNTKNGASFAVTGHASGPVYALDRIREHFPAVSSTDGRTKAASADAPALIGDVFDQTRIDATRKRLDNKNTLLLKKVESTVLYIDRIPQRLNEFVTVEGKDGTTQILKDADGNPRRNQTYRLLTEATYRAAWRNKGGSWDASLVRYMVCKGLIYCGYDANTIIAFLDFFEDPETKTIKGAGNLAGDYARLFSADKLGPLYAQQQAKQRERRARLDRPQRYTPESYLTWLQAQQQDGSVPHKRRERAEQAGISCATLDRLENVLERAGSIRIDTASDRSGSIVVLLTGVINIVESAAADAPEPTPARAAEVLSGECDEAPESAIATPESAIDAVMHKEHTPAPSPAGGADAGGVFLAAQPPTLPAAVLAQMTMLPRDQVHAKTGELTRWPITVKRVTAAIRAQYPGVGWTDAMIRDAYQRVRKAQRQAEWDRLHALKRDDLDRKLAMTQQTIDRYEKRAAGADKPEVGHYYAVEAKKRLGLLAQLRYEAGKRPAVVERDIIAEAEQRECLALAKRARVPAAPRTPVAVRVEPTMPPIDPWHQVRSMVERLKARKGETSCYTVADSVATA